MTTVKDRIRGNAETDDYYIIDDDGIRIPDHTRLEGTNEFLRRCQPVDVADVEDRTYGTPVASRDGTVYVDTEPCHCLIIGGSGTGKTLSFTLIKAIQALKAGHSVVYQASRRNNLKVLQDTAKQLGIEPVIIDLENPQYSDPFPILFPVSKNIRSEDPWDRIRGMNMASSIVNSALLFNSTQNAEWLMGTTNFTEGALEFVTREIDGPEMNTRSILKVVETVLDPEDSPLKRTIEDDDHYKAKFGSILLQSAMTTLEGYKSVFHSTFVLTLCSPRFAPVLNGSRTEIFSMDQKQQLLILISPEGDPIAASITKMILSILHDVLVDNVGSYGGTSELPVDFILDEFGFLGFEAARQWVSQDRERGFYHTHGCQSLRQITADDDSILDNYKILIFTGSSNISTLNEFQSMLVVNRIPLISADQLRKMQVGEAVIITRGRNPYYARMMNLRDMVDSGPLEGKKREYVDLPTIDKDFVPKSKKSKKVIFDLNYSEYLRLTNNVKEPEDASNENKKKAVKKEVEDDQERRIKHDEEVISLLHGVQAWFDRDFSDEDLLGYMAMKTNAELMKLIREEGFTIKRRKADPTLTDALYEWLAVKGYDVNPNMGATIINMAIEGEQFDFMCVSSKAYRVPAFHGRPLNIGKHYILTTEKFAYAEVALSIIVHAVRCIHGMEEGDFLKDGDLWEGRFEPLRKVI